jgi:L-alanine-DL-glutamate epimerase-like enolase superfamily enzyme
MKRCLKDKLLPPSWKAIQRETIFTTEKPNPKGERQLGEQIKVKSIEVFKSEIAFKEPFKITLMQKTTAQSIFIKINSNLGIYGLGEANPLRGITGETQSINYAGAIELARLVLQADPRNIEGQMGTISNFLVHNSTLRSAFDMAFYDLVAKLIGVPLYTLLGGGKRKIQTDSTIWLNEPEYMAQKAVELKDEGFRVIKVKLGTEFEMDKKRIERIRESIGGELTIRIDANQGWDYVTAAKTLQELEPMNIEFCEQPVAYWDYENLRRISHSSPIAIMADESLFDHHDAFRLACMGCCDYFNIKLAKSGGIHNALKINAIAEGAGIACMIGCMSETRLGLSAAAHLASATSNIKFADLDGYMMLTEDPIVGGARYNAGEIDLPESPGHGADIDPAFLKHCEGVIIE